MAIIDQVRQFVVQYHGMDPELLQDDASLLDDDLFAEAMTRGPGHIIVQQRLIGAQAKFMLKLCDFVHQTFELEIDDSDISLDDFQSVDDVVAFIKRGGPKRQADIIDIARYASAKRAASGDAHRQAQPTPDAGRGWDSSVPPPDIEVEDDQALAALVKGNAGLSARLEGSTPEEYLSGLGTVGWTPDIG